MKPVGVAVVGDVLDINAWSNIPYYFFTTGKNSGIFDEPWSLNLQALNNARILWNIKQLVTLQGKGGFQYSKKFLDIAEKQIPNSYFSSTVISFNQVFPRASSVLKRGGKVYYYIDSTLHDLFNEPDYGISIPEETKAKAIDLERENFNRAEKVVTMGSWVHESLATIYGLPENKIAHILPGANVTLPEGWKPFNPLPNPGKDRDLILGFIGKDWQRKGLPLLIQVRDELAERGYKVKVRAIGKCPEEFKNREGVEFSGFVNKQTETKKFIELISLCDIGCLFSSTEALGISILEFLRVGVPVAGFYHQGLRETLLESASIRFNLNEGVQDIADGFESFIENAPYRASLRNAAISNTENVTWEKCIKEWEKLIG